jgi:hypothetical protein
MRSPPPPPLLAVELGLALAPRSLLRLLAAPAPARFAELAPLRACCCPALAWRLAAESPRAVPPNLFAVALSA